MSGETKSWEIRNFLASSQPAVPGLKCTVGSALALLQAKLLLGFFLFEPGLELSPTLALSAPNHLLHRHTLWGISRYLKGQIISNRGLVS